MAHRIRFLGAQTPSTCFQSLSLLDKSNSFAQHSGACMVWSLLSTLASVLLSHLVLQQQRTAQRFQNTSLYFCTCSYLHLESRPHSCPPGRFCHLSSLVVQGWLPPCEVFPTPMALGCRFLHALTLCRQHLLLSSLSGFS